MGVIIGVDPHKASCTAAVLDEHPDGFACATPLGQVLA